jgi:hypothetical protein
MAGIFALLAISAHADTFGSGGNTFGISFVPIGSAGNAADSTGYGAVSYNFNISTYAISQADMNLAVANGFTNGTTGDWTGNQPATSITWYQAAAFVNWLNTSQGYAAAYNLDPGATTVTLWSPAQAFPLGGGLYDLYRNANAHYFLPTEDEYYKSGYYDPSKPGGAGYWLYATGSDTAPVSVTSGMSAGTAVYGNPSNSAPAAVDQAGGLSPFGTMGQTGNVFEWMESDYNGGYNPTQYPGAAVRGGSWMTPGTTSLQSSSRNFSATGEVFTLGFRVASVPEPSSTLLVMGPCLMFLARRRRAAGLAGHASKSNG